MNLLENVPAALFRSHQGGRAVGFGLLTLLYAFAAFSRALNPLGVAAQEPAKLVTTTERLTAATIASPDDISRWIDELGHDAFTVRQAAASRLLAAGMSAREPLRAIVDGPDPEKRAAARRLVALIDQSEFHRRLEAFAADTDGRQGLTLPGWDQYQKLVGGDPAGARTICRDATSRRSADFGHVRRLETSPKRLVGIAPRPAGAMAKRGA